MQAVLIAAIVTMVLAIGLLYLPTSADPVEYEIAGTVSCGSFILQSDYATDATCEKAILRRVAAAALAGLITVILTIVGGVMWIIDIRRSSP